MNEDIQRRIREKINEIEEKSAGGNYIYRGEPEDYGKVSSSLWRKFRNEIAVAAFEIRFIQKELLKAARNYDFDSEEDDFEIMSRLQHYDGKTNLIDFTTDFHIALFFACDGHHDKNGRIIFLRQTEVITDWIREPQCPENRVRAQKSIFVQPPEGFIEPHKEDIITIPANLKQPLLQYLRTCYCIATETIYNDLHGFIKHQSSHQDAYKEFYIGLSYLSINKYTRAITNFNKAIELNPNFAEAYVSRGNAYGNQGELSLTILDYNKAIKLNSNYVQAYSNRGHAYLLNDEICLAIVDFDKVIGFYAGDAGDPAVRYNMGRTSIPYDVWLSDARDPFVHYNRGMAWLHCREWEKARLDLVYARDMMVDIISSFQEDYESIEVFEEKYGIQLPADIAEMLTDTSP